MNNRINFTQVKKDIKNYDIFEVLDTKKYGNYYLNIYNESDTILIHLSDLEGYTTSKIDKKKFLEMSISDIKKLLNEVLYYNYIQNEV